MISCVGAGLLSSIQLGTSSSRIMGYQILYGIGLGCTYQNVLVAVQAEWRDRTELIPRATALITFGEIFGGVLGVSIAGGCFFESVETQPCDERTNRSCRNYFCSWEKCGCPQGARSQSPWNSFTHSIAQTFFIGVVASVLISLCAMTVRNISIAESPEKVSWSNETWFCLACQLILSYCLCKFTESESLSSSFAPLMSTICFLVYMVTIRIQYYSVPNTALSTS